MIKKILSFLLLVGVTSTVSLGGYVVISSSINGDSNYKIISSITTRNDKSRLLAMSDSISTTKNQAVLGTTINSKECSNEDVYSYRTNSVVEYLHHVGIEHSYESRIELANKYGILDYRGTEKQNGDLIEFVRNDNNCIK